MTIDRSGIKNVLILRTDHLGDLLLSTPLLRSLRMAHARTPVRAGVFPRQCRSVDRLGCDR